MKKFLSLLLISCFLILAFVGCNDKNHNTENNTTAETTADNKMDESNEEKYAQALALLEKKDYVSAHAILKELGDYKNANEMLQHFHYVLLEVVETMEYATTDSTETSMHYYTYNEDNLLANWISGDRKAEYTYDENGNLIKKFSTYPNSDGKQTSQTVEYTYDADGNMLKETCYVAEKIYSFYEFVYDSNGNMVKKSYYERFIPYDPTFPPSLQYTIDYTHDVNNRLVKQVTTRSSNDSTIVEYAYDAAGRLTEECVGNSTYQYTYDESGNLLKKTLGDNIIDEYNYDASGNLIKQINLYGSTRYIYEYTYDADGKLIEEVHKVESEEKLTLNYYYDADGNLNYKTKSFGGTIYYTYTYDVNGNLIKHTDVGYSNLKQFREMTYQLVYIPTGIPEQIEETICPKY